MEIAAVLLALTYVFGYVVLAVCICSAFVFVYGRPRRRAAALRPR